MSDLFTYARESARRRDRGMALASAAQEADRPGWKDRAYAALERLAFAQKEIHVDDLTAVFTEEPEHHNAWGGVWQRAIKSGVLVHSGRVKPCADVRKHRHNSPIYISQIYRGRS